MICIDFFGGTHGNFLAYVINSLDPEFNRSILPFTEFGTSHNPYNKNIADAEHYSYFNLPVPPTAFIISLTVSDIDCLLLNLLCFGRSGDCNFDLKNFHIKLYDQIKNTRFVNLVPLIKNAYNYDLAQHNSIPRGMLREFFKFGFKDNSNGLYVAAQQLKYVNRGIAVNFRKLYVFESFVEIITTILARNKLPFDIDVYWLKRLHQEFISKNKELERENECYQVLNAIKNQKYLKIDFNLLQESWLNAQIENIYKVETPYDQNQYFTDTTQILEFIKQ